MKIFSQIETTPDEIGKMAKAVSDRIDGDKDAICLLLYFCNVFTQGWYNEIIDKLNPLHVKEAAVSNRKLTAIELTPLIEFIERSYYKHLVNVESSLKKVLDLFANGELINILDEKKIIDIRRIRHNLVYYGTVAADQKNEWYQTSIKNRSLDFDAQVIDDWENELATISRRVSKLELRLEVGLGCQQNQTSELFRQYRERRRRRWYGLWRT
jgi:hypothetical protein